MKYKIITIKPVEDKWVVNVSELLFDRINKKQKPSPLGFYYFPETMSSEQAFQKLKDVMIKAHEKRIEELNKSLNELKKLTFTVEVNDKNKTGW